MNLKKIFLNKNKAFKKKKISKLKALPKKQQITIKVMCAVTFALFFISLCSGLITGLFGFGYETQNIINSLKNELRQNIDHTHLVIDAKKIEANALDSLAFGIALSHAYQIDAVSTLSESEIFNRTIFNEYVKTADTQFKIDWIDTGYIEYDPGTIEPYHFKKDINLYDFAFKVLDFDKIVASKYKKEFVSPGLWVSTKKDYIDQLLSSNYKTTPLYQEMKTTSEIVDQNIYDNGNGTTTHGMTLLMNIYLLNAELHKNAEFTFQTREQVKNENINPVYYGIHIANNKIWFSNWQVNNLKRLVNILGDEGRLVLSDANFKWYQNNKNAAIKTFELSGLYKTDYTKDFVQLRAATVINLFITPILFLLFSATLSISWIMIKKHQKAINNQSNNLSKD